MMYYTVYYDTNGNITGIHSYGDKSFTLASNQIEITEEQYQNLSQYPPGYFIITNSQFTVSLNGVQNDQIQKITQSYNNANTQPIAYMNTVFQSDQNSQNLLQGSLTVYTALGSVPQGFYWLDANNNQVTMTLQQLQGLGQAIANRTNSNFQKLQLLKQQIKSATTIEQVQAVVW